MISHGIHAALTQVWGWNLYYRLRIKPVALQLTETHCSSNWSLWVLENRWNSKYPYPYLSKKTKTTITTTKSGFVWCPTRGLKTRLHWWKAGTLTTTPALVLLLFGPWRLSLPHIYAAYLEVDCLERVRKPGLGSRPDSHFNM